ncbi:hypothetical protein BDR26DRAFT_861865 [Obelidium mucronatum]|nr:hypothetical protein BDR26DRAFT_861865 [Obelidium mucronatum]
MQRRFLVSVCAAPTTTRWRAKEVLLRLRFSTATAATKDIFAIVHEKIPAFNQPNSTSIQPQPSIPAATVIDLNMPESDILSRLLPADLLPPAPVLDLLHTEGRISVKTEDMYQIVAMVKFAWPALTAASTNPDQLKKVHKSLSERILAVCTLRDLTTIATILYEHNTAAPSKHLGFQMLHLAKEAGDMDAEFKYAHVLSRGFPSVPRDLPRSIEMLESLVARKHALSMYVYALRLIKQGAYPLLNVKESVIEEPETASTSPSDAEQQQQQEKESEFAASNAKGVVEERKVDEKVIAKGLRYLYTCATELSYPQALIQMGHLFLNGILVQKDPKKAYELLERAAEKGVTEAMFLCGSCWEKGEGVESADLNKALEWWTKAANRGLAIGQHNVGAAYFEGSLIPKSIPLAVEYFEMAAIQNLPLSLMNLAKLYQEGYSPSDKEPKSWTIEPDSTKSRDYAQQVVDLGGEWAEIGQQFLDAMPQEIKETKIEEPKQKPKKRWWE